MELLKTSYSVYKIKYHIVLCVKYRKLLLEEKIRIGIIKILKEISERFEIYYDEIGFESDHVHIMCGANPKYSPSYIVMITKSKTALQIFKKFPSLRKELWGGKFWSAGKFIGTVGDGLNEDIIRKYIQGQEKGKADGNIVRQLLFPLIGV